MYKRQQFAYSSSGVLPAGATTVKAGRGHQQLVMSFSQLTKHITDTFGFPAYVRVICSCSCACSCACACACACARLVCVCAFCACACYVRVRCVLASCAECRVHLVCVRVCVHACARYRYLNRQAKIRTIFDEYLKEARKLPAALPNFLVRNESVLRITLSNVWLHKVSEYHHHWQKQPDNNGLTIAAVLLLDRLIHATDRATPKQTTPHPTCLLYTSPSPRDRG